MRGETSDVLRRCRLALLVFAAFGAACAIPDSLRSRVRSMTPHEQYGMSLRRAGLDSTALGRDWLAASDSALRTPLALSLPFREVAAYRRGEARAVAYGFTLSRGRRVDITLQHQGLPTRLFVDLYRVSAEPGVFVHEASARTDSAGAQVIGFESRDSAAYLLRVQPELLRDGTFEVLVRAGPSLAFPVQGGTNRWVQSLFGVPRDAGRRRHEGIDIFAPRGTPVVASVDGMVQSTRSNPLGGLVVWLRDPGRRLTLYYAHLDAHAVTEGQVVSIGDTIGFVGNTGNARTTRPHLHFGVYASGEGAIDPWPWVRLAEGEPAAIVADRGQLGARVVATASPAMLRLRPGYRADSVRQVTGADSLDVAGVNGGWYRVYLPTGESGYIAANAVRPLPDDAPFTEGRRVNGPRAGASADTR